MRFGDTSAIIPLLLREDSSSSMLGILETDPMIITSAFSVVEIASAVWRRRHAGELSLAAHQETDSLFAGISRTWIELPVDESVVEQAIGLISRSRLRAGDALLLATAMSTGEMPFVTLDRDQAAAARREGLTVLP